MLFSGLPVIFSWWYYVAPNIIAIFIVSFKSKLTGGLWKVLIGSIFQFSFPDYVMDTIRREGFQQPTVIQAQVICLSLILKSQEKLEGNRKIMFCTLDTIFVEYIL